MQPTAATFIDKWLQYNAGCADEFIKRIYSTTRAIYTVIRNELPTSTTNSNFYLGEPSKDKVPRVDKMIAAAKRIPRANSTPFDRLFD